MTHVSIIGLDLAKTVFQAHGADAPGARSCGAISIDQSITKSERRLPTCSVSLILPNGYATFVRVSKRSRGAHLQPGSAEDPLRHLVDGEPVDLSKPVSIG